MLDRLHQVGIEARGPGALAILVLAAAGHRDQHDLLAPGLVAQAARHFVAVQSGQADVQENDIGMERRCGIDR